MHFLNVFIYVCAGEDDGNHDADNVLEPEKNIDAIDDSYEKDDADKEYCQDSDSESEEEEKFN